VPVDRLEDGIDVVELLVLGALAPSRGAARRLIGQGGVTLGDRRVDAPDSRVTRDELERDGVLVPDSVIGTDSHTTMASGLGVLGWGVGGLEAEALLLGRPLNVAIPSVVGVRLRLRRMPSTRATAECLLCHARFLMNPGNPSE